MFMPLIKNEHDDKSDGDYIKDINGIIYLPVKVAPLDIMFIPVSSTPDTYLKSGNKRLYILMKLNSSDRWFWESPDKWAKLNHMVSVNTTSTPLDIIILLLIKSKEQQIKDKTYHVAKNNETGEEEFYIQYHNIEDYRFGFKDSY